MAGQVFIFNTYSHTVSMTLNGYPLDKQPLAAATTGTYAPTSQAVNRNSSSGDPGTNEFGGSNALLVAYGGGGHVKKYEIDNISFDDVDSDDDIQLYLFFNTAMLVATQNAAPVPIQGQTPTAAEEQAVLAVASA
jgi:hypothetical protein